MRLAMRAATEVAVRPTRGQPWESAFGRLVRYAPQLVPRGANAGAGAAASEVEEAQQALARIEVAYVLDRDGGQRAAQIG